MKSEDIVRIQNAAFHKDGLDIRWHITSACNYQCDFCIQGNADAHRRQAEGENAATRMAVCMAIRQFMDSRKDCSFIKMTLVGGEVSILSDFPQILRILSESTFPGTIQFEITTNFSKPAAYFAELAKIVRKHDRTGKRRLLHITASYYAAYAAQDAFSEKALEFRKLTAPKAAPKLFARKRKQDELAFAVVYPVLKDADYAAFLLMRARLGEAGIPVIPLVIRQYKTELSPAVRAEMLGLLNKTPSLRVTTKAGETLDFSNIQALGGSLEDRDSFCPKGYRCDAGVHNIWVNAFGDVYRCPAIGSDMIMGNLLAGSVDLLKEPAICTSGHCSCSQFSLIELPD